MNETTNDGSNKKKGVSKGIIAITIIAVLAIGGAVAAFMLNNLSLKESYFLAEKKSTDFMIDKVEERYEPELDWYEHSKENATESKVDLSGEYNVPSTEAAYGGVDPSQIINNSNLTITAATDMENKQISTDIAASIGGIEVNDVNLSFTNEKLMLSLPFVEEVIQLKDADLGPLLYELDPVSFTGEETLELDSIFEGNGGLSEEDREYFKEEYGKMIYDQLPEDAFTTEDETVEVNGESINAEKISMQLTEKQVKEILTAVFDKMEKDDKLKDLIRKQAGLQLGGTAAVDPEIDQLLSDFETGIAEAKDGLADLQIPNGFNSTIWVENDLIVQRDLAIEMGPSAEELVTFSVKGGQLLKDTTQFFDYDFGLTESGNESVVNIAGNLTWEDNKASDKISLTADEFTLAYDGTETLTDGTRDFERIFTFEESATSGSLNWNGSATYNKDQMSSENSFSIESPDISQDMFALHANVEGKTIDKVEMPAEDNVKDLGEMGAQGTMEYFELEVVPSFQEWLFTKLAGSGNF
ncbi:DUF6583 family protein [Oceanobacillus chungangensis]|uniref:DUF945 domain-containing protein n=1 Tax=Oceanobacillus chungangensis TaxID=1229152 RepID=A0A3D8Q380_9BACI|nr:DUF6583 family protein [Oceanobacillus chungangensis]RDW21615.1 hypothetical protein CWR45_01705 [Oceanobacillus chungangensis]